MKHRSRIFLAAIVALGSACGGGGDSYGSGPGPGNSTGSTSTSITVKNNLFDPSATTVAVGSSVSWTWAQGAVTHNVTFNDGQKSPDQSSGGYVRVFDKAGAFPYHCTFHPAMTGTVTVQ